MRCVLSILNRTSFSRSLSRLDQKRSDATLGVERVYDKETGEIYKVPNGWGKKFDSKRFRPITDEEYEE